MRNPQIDEIIHLQNLLEKLIQQEKEGDYWDFKECHHEKAGKLIHDIICLANTIRHQGDRYIIFGVTNDGKITGIENDGKRKNQSDIINTLSNAGFSGNSYPDVFLKEVSIDEKNIDILIIKDKPEKPYYLQKEYNSQGVKINSGTIYTRIRDANTGRDQVAPATDIEKMWRERFGLDSTPFERIKIYLQDFDGWEETAENEWHYNQFPEFTVTKTDEENWEVRGGENWVRAAATNPQAFVRPMCVKYYQTVLKNVDCIYYDETRFLVPAPKPISVEKLWFYGVYADSFDFYLLQFLTKRKSSDLLNHGLEDRTSRKLPVIIFSSRFQKDNFINYLKLNPSQINISNSQLPLHSEITDQDRKIIEYSEAVINIFQSWK